MQASPGKERERDKKKFKYCMNPSICCAQISILNVKRYFASTVTYDLFHPLFTVDEWMSVFFFVRGPPIS